MKNDKLLHVGYLAPGWPLSDFPNGIVAYIENILSGFDGEVDSVVLAMNMKKISPVKQVVDLRNYNKNYINIPNKVYAKLLAKLKHSSAGAAQYRNTIVDSAISIQKAVEVLKTPLDILEVEETFGSAYYSIGKINTHIVTRLHGPGFIMQELSNSEETEQSRLRIFYEGETIKRSHGVTSPSLDVLEKVRDYYNLELPNAKVIPNPAFLTSKEKQWKLAEHNPYILFVGRFDTIKGGDLIINAFRIIAQQDKQVTLYFVGPDNGIVINGRNFNIYEYIEENIPQESIRSRIKFYGHCDADKIIELRQSAVITVCCSRYENHSVSLLEAISAGCPTIATAVGGNKEIIVDGYNGYLVEPESPENLAEQALSLLNDTSQLEMISVNAIADSAARYSSKKIAGKTLDFYKTVLANY